MNIDSIVHEELESLYEGFDYNKVLGKVIATTQQIIDQANADNITAIEPDSTWETMYQFESVRLTNTQLVIKYLENAGRGWEKKTDITNLTQDRNQGFQDSKYVLSWIRRAIKKGYTAERREMKAQDKLNLQQDKIDLQEQPEMMGLQELAQILSNINPEAYPLDMMIKMLQEEYQNNGDEGIVNFLKQNAGMSLQILGKGKYAYK